MKFLKTLAALSILASLALPLSQCAGPQRAPSEDTDVRYSTEENGEVIYPYSWVSVTEPGTWILPLALIWPAMFTAFAGLAKKRGAKIGVAFIELLLGGCSMVAVWQFASLGSPQIGAYTGLMGFILYVAVVAFTLWRTQFYSNTEPDRSRKIPQADNAV